MQRVTVIPGDGIGPEFVYAADRKGLSGLRSNTRSRQRERRSQSF